MTGMNLCGMFGILFFSCHAFGVGRCKTAIQIVTSQEFTHVPVREFEFIPNAEKEIFLKPQSYKGRWPPIRELTPDGFQGKEGQFVLQKRAEVLNLGKYVTSSGFSTCHVILLRDRSTGREALMHYTFMLSFEQRLVLTTFTPNKTDIVFFGNSSSAHLKDAEVDLIRTGYTSLKIYKVQEEGRWELVYWPNRSEIIYHNYDRKLFYRLTDIFPR